MREDSVSDIVRQLAGEWDDRSFALYFPRPVVELGSEKWRIFQKNLLSALEKSGARDSEAAKLVAGLGISDIGGQGMALFQTGQGLHTARMSHRPLACLVFSDQPFVLPLISDLADVRSEWVLVLDRDDPRLYLFDGQNLTLRADAFEQVDYEKVENRRVVQDDIFFHSSSRGAQGAPRGPSIFHALGADQSHERDKTDEAYFREVIDALLATLPGQVRKLTVFGDPHTVGPFEKLIAPTGLDITQHHGAGDALSEARVEETLGKTGRPTAFALDLASDRDRIDQAAQTGQVDTLYFCETLSCLERTAGDPSEHLRIRNRNDLAAEVAANAVVVRALSTGAAVEMYAAHEAAGTADMLASLRWTHEQVAAGRASG